MNPKEAPFHTFSGLFTTFSVPFQVDVQRVFRSENRVFNDEFFKIQPKLIYGKCGAS